MRVRVLSAVLMGRAPTTRNGLTIALVCLAISCLAHPAFSQDTTSTGSRAQVAGAISITNKGISTVPSFTLGKPAATVDVSIRKGNLGFEPQFNFGLNGKPWTSLFWLRYRLPEGDKLHLTVGAHLAIAFATLPVSVSGASRDVIVARRYLAGELSPSYSLSKNVLVGAYYLYSHGFEQGVTKNIHFLAPRVSFTHVKLTREYFMRVNPQVYYLKTDRRDGFYLYSGLTLAKSNSPLSISAIVNRTIQTSVLASEDLLWNVSLNYSIK